MLELISFHMYDTRWSLVITGSWTKRLNYFLTSYFDNSFSWDVEPAVSLTCYDLEKTSHAIWLNYSTIKYDNRGEIIIDLALQSWEVSSPAEIQWTWLACRIEKQSCHVPFLARPFPLPYSCISSAVYPFCLRLTLGELIPTNPENLLHSFHLLRMLTMLMVCPSW